MREFEASGALLARQIDPFDRLEAAIRAEISTENAGLPFAGGWVGVLPYEVGAAREGVRAHKSQLGETDGISLFLYDCAAVFDHATQEWSVAGVDLAGSKAPVGERLDRLTRLLASADGVLASAAGVCAHLAARGPASGGGGRLAANVSKEQYFQKVERAIRYIEAGDIYQVNLSQRFTAATDRAPLDLYLALRAVNPADFAALMPWGERVVLSASPELFLDLRGRRVVTRPIKGTRPRGGDARSDARRREELVASGKDRAELNMIVDLMRNDLGRVGEFGSVRVVEAAQVEAHPTVWHLVATIEGQLRGETTAVDLLRAAFPGGSITGCPKIRAMQIIRELEPTPRGVYCGSIGYIGLDGSMCWNIAIRTMVYERRGGGGRLHLYAGGAITADSDPQAEYEEIMAKAAGMMRAIGGDGAVEPGAEEPEEDMPAEAGRRSRA